MKTDAIEAAIAVSENESWPWGSEGAPEQLAALEARIRELESKSKDAEHENARLRIALESERAAHAETLRSKLEWESRAAVALAELSAARPVLEAARLVAGSHDNGECRSALNDELAFRIDVLDGDEDALAELARRAGRGSK